MRSIACPLCAGRSFSPVASRSRRGTTYCIVRCATCGFYHVNPEPDAAELAAFYDAEYRDRHGDVWHGLEDSANRAVLRLLGRLNVRSLVDLGAGQGRFVAMAREANIEATGVEPVADNVAAARDRYGLTLHHAPVEGWLRGEPRSLECVTMLNVLEHLPNPLGVVKGVAGALRPGGHLLAIVPNVAFTLTLGRLRRALGFSDEYLMHSSRFSQQGFDPPIHLSSFDGHHLRELFARAGLSVRLLRQAPVIDVRNPVMQAAKHGVRLVGSALELATAGRVHWGYSSLVVAQWAPGARTPPRSSATRA